MTKTRVDGIVWVTMRYACRSRAFGPCLLLLVACGGRVVGAEGAGGYESGGESGADPEDDPDQGEGATGGEESADTGEPPPPPLLDLGPAEPPPEGCLACTIEIEAKLSGGFELLGGEFVASIEFEGVPVYAAGEYGAGRFIAAADSNFPFREVSDCALHDWLAGTHDAQVLWFGWTGEEDHELPITADIAGIHLPDAYVGRPDLLAADYDTVLYSEGAWLFAGQEQPTDVEMQTLLDYVYEYGGGLYVASEYAEPGGGYLGPLDLWSVNRLLVPLGLRARGFNLGSGSASTQLDCFDP